MYASRSSGKQEYYKTFVRLPKTICQVVLFGICNGHSQFYTEYIFSRIISNYFDKFVKPLMMKQVLLEFHNVVYMDLNLKNFVITSI